jgi:GLPGLI family protein
MKKYTLFISFLIAFTSYCQTNAKITYKSLLLKNSYAPIYEELIINGHQSTYSLIKKIKPESAIVNEQTGITTLNRKWPDSIHPFILVNYKKKEIISKVYLTENDGDSFKEYSILEPFSIKWVLHQQTSQIKNYNCKKATTKFRGRVYTAWYTEQIPLPIGPWKFSGLPGLILKVQDDKGEISFIAENIKIPHNTTLKIPKTIYSNNITINAYSKLRDDYDKKSEKIFRTKLLAKLPRGASIEMTEDDNNEIEKKIE